MKLKIIENQASSALDTLKIPEEKLNDILNAADSGPIGKIKSTEENLGGIVQIFEYIITLSPLLFLANSGPTSSGATQDQITEKVLENTVEILGPLCRDPCIGG